MAVSNNLKLIRKERHIGQAEIANATGSCRLTISRIERGERNPSLEMAIRIARFFDLAVEDIFQIQDI